MTDIVGNLSFIDKVKLLGYGYKLCFKMTPLYLPFLLLRSIFTAAMPLSILFFSARILDELNGTRDVQTVVLYVSITIGVTFLLQTLRAFLTREIETVGRWELLYQRVRMMVAERYAQMDYTHVEDTSISEVLARMDTQARGNGLGILNIYNFSTQASESLFSIIFSWIMLRGPLSVPIHGEIRWPVYALVAFFIVSVLFILKMQTLMQKKLEMLYVENAKANTASAYYRNYVDVNEAAKDIRLYNQSASIFEIFKISFDVKKWSSFFFFEAKVSGIMFAVLAVLTGSYYIIAGYSALMGNASFGAIVQSVGAVTIFGTAIGSFIVILGQIYNNTPFIKPMKDYLELPDVLLKGNKPINSKSKSEFNFEFKSVSFKYPAAENFALENVNLKFKVGERLAVVGQNGSGKTTMIKLLCRLYDPTEGEILLNGVNIQEYDYVQYTTLFSVVFQDFFLYPLEVGANVASKEVYDKSRVRECLENAGFSDRLEKMPDGLNTILYKSYDEDGTQISGGEAQKIALARALYRDAPFIILDEPTAALDPISEYEVYSTFDKTIADKTAVFISHRLSSCRFCHDIAVFDKGKIIQQGSHETLLSDESGLYRRLWDAQAQHYVD